MFWFYEEFEAEAVHDVCGDNHWEGKERYVITKLRVGVFRGTYIVTEKTNSNA